MQITEQKMQEMIKNLDEKEKQVQEQELKLKELEKENNKLRENLIKTEEEKDKLNELMLNLKISKEESERNDKIFQDKLNKFIQYGEVDPNFAKMLSLLKLQNYKLETRYFKLKNKYIVKYLFIFF